MKQKKRLTLLWRKLNFLELGKDVVLVPYYLGQALGYQVEICCGFSDDLAKYLPQKQGLNFKRKDLTHNPFQRIPIYIKYLLQNAQHIDLLMCFHWKLETFINILLYKYLNKNGQVYIKLDTIDGREWELSERSFFNRIMRKKIYKTCLKKIKVLSCETTKSYNLLCRNKEFGNLLKEKLVWMPNAFDETYLQTLDIFERSYSQKENLIITIGRLGSSQKNTEMLLKALEKTDLKNWKFYLIGPIEPHFKPQIEQFYKDFPEKKEQVIFIGKINDKKELWEWYNKAKVFVFTSRWESYGLVLDEAKRFRNYLVCTRVGAAEDSIENDRYGTFIEQEDSEGLNQILSQIINGKIVIDVYQDYDSKQLSYSQRIRTLLDYLS